MFFETKQSEVIVTLDTRIKNQIKVIADPSKWTGNNKKKQREREATII